MNAYPTAHPPDRTLKAFGLGQLDVASAGSVNAHVQGCPECRQRVATLSSGGFRDAEDRPASQHSAVSSTDGLSMLWELTGGASPPPPGSLPPGLADHPDYQILRELGQGGMGVVYLAQNTLMGRLEVLKVVSGHLVNRRGVLDRFLGEIRNAAKLHHPNIVAAYSALRLGESLVLAMEYVEGLDLSRLVKGRGPLSVANACGYVQHAAMGLQHAHEHGMVHRDIKPGNLMLARQGNKAVVKVLDFGLAKVQSEGAVDSGLTHEGQMLGTPDYIAPEQISNARRADIRADIYSLGCTFYYLLTGRPPFQGASLYDLLQAHHSMEATPLNLVRPEVPVQVAAIVAKMMAKEPERRFQEPKDVAQALKSFLNSRDANSPESRPIELATKVGIASVVPAAASREFTNASPTAMTVIETQPEMRQRRRLVGTPAWAIAGVATVLLASLTTAVWTWVSKGPDRAVADRTARATETGTIPKPAPAPVLKPTPPEPRPAGNDPEVLVRDALSALRRGNLNRARSLVNQYLARPGSGRQVDTARTLLSDIDLATSSIEAEALARRLSDQDIQGYLAAGGQPLVDNTLQSPELRRVYAQTLIQSFRREMDRRRPASKVAGATAQRPRQGPSPARNDVARARSGDDGDINRRPAGNSLGSTGRTAPAPVKAPDRKGPTTLETVIDAPGSFEGREVLLDGLYKVGTLLTPVKGSDGQSIGSSLPIGGGDDRLICKGDGKAMGRDRYLVLDSRLAPILLHAFNEYHFVRAARPAHKCTLTVTVRPTVMGDISVPVVTIVGLEILGICNFVQVSRNQFDKAFMTVRVTPEKAWTEYGDGVAWVERLGGQEKFLAPLHQKLKDVRRKAIADRGMEVLGSALNAELARSMNTAIANSQQQARFAAAFFGRR